MSNGKSKKKKTDPEANRLLGSASTRFAFLMLLAVSELGPAGASQLCSILSSSAR